MDPLYYDILDSFDLPDLLRTDSVSKPKAVKMDILRTLSDLYAQGWNAGLTFQQKKNNIKYLETISILKNS